LLLVILSSIINSVIRPRFISYFTMSGSMLLISSWLPLMSFSLVTESAMIPNFLSSLVIIVQLAYLF
jgi:hypothetical protein